MVFILVSLKNIILEFSYWIIKLSYLNIIIREFKYLKNYSFFNQQLYIDLIVMKIVKKEKRTSAACKCGGGCVSNSCKCGGGCICKCGGSC